jgi:hypothetical protein
MMIIITKTVFQYTGERNPFDEELEIIKYRSVCQIFANSVLEIIESISIPQDELDSRSGRIFNFLISRPIALRKVFMFVCLYVCIYVCTYVRMDICMCIYEHIFICIYTYGEFLRAHIYEHIRTCMYIYIYKYEYIYRFLCTIPRIGYVPLLNWILLYGTG